MRGISLTTLSPDTQDGVIRLLQRELFVDPITHADFARKVLLDPNLRTDCTVVALRGREVIGFMLGIVRRYPLEDAPPDNDRGWVTLMVVDSDHQRKGIGSAMLGRILDSLSANHASSVWVSPYAPNYFMPGVDESAYPGAIRFLAKHGFRGAYRPLSMEADLAGLRVPDWVQEKQRILADDGLRVRAFAPEHILPLTHFLSVEFPGDWQRLMRESMQRAVDGGCTGGRIFTAMRDGLCLGFCWHDGERFGPFGVMASERGRGLGAVLLFRCLESMKADGMSRAWFMWTDDRAARLYSQAGFRETRRFSVMMRS